MAEFESEYFVYALGVSGDVPFLSGATKIGIARSPEARLRGCQTGSPVRLHIKKTWGFNSEQEARAFESACHDEFADRKLHLEWFEVSVDEVDDLRDQFYSEWDAVGEVAELQRAMARRGGDAQTEKDGIPIVFRARKKAEGNPELLTTPEAANLLGKSASWLNKTRMKGTGPTYVKVGGSVRYRPADIQAWLQSIRRTAVYDFNNKVSA